MRKRGNEKCLEVVWFLGLGRGSRRFVEYVADYVSRRVTASGCLGATSLHTTSHLLCHFSFSKLMRYRLSLSFHQSNRISSLILVPFSKAMADISSGDL